MIKSTAFKHTKPNDNRLKTGLLLIMSGLANENIVDIDAIASI